MDKMDQLMKLHNMDEMNQTMKFFNKRKFNDMNKIHQMMTFHKLNETHNHFECIKFIITCNTITTPTHLGYQFQSFNKNV